MGGPTPTVRWAFNNSSTFNHTDVFTHPQHGNVISGTIMSTLHIVNAQYPTNNGVYTCLGINSEFNSSSANVTVQVLGTEIYFQ